MTAFDDYIAQRVDPDAGPTTEAPTPVPTTGMHHLARTRSKHCQSSKAREPGPSQPGGSDLDASARSAAVLASAAHACASAIASLSVVPMARRTAASAFQTSAHAALTAGSSQYAARAPSWRGGNVSKTGYGVSMRGGPGTLQSIGSPGAVRMQSGTGSPAAGMMQGRGLLTGPSEPSRARGSLADGAAHAVSVRASRRAARKCTPTAYPCRANPQPSSGSPRAPVPRRATRDPRGRLAAPASPHQSDHSH